MCGEAYSNEDIQLLSVESCVLSFQPEWAPGLKLNVCVVFVYSVNVQVCVYLCPVFV